MGGPGAGAVLSGLAPASEPGVVPTGRHPSAESAHVPATTGRHVAWEGCGCCAGPRCSAVAPTAGRAPLSVADTRGPRGWAGDVTSRPSGEGQRSLGVVPGRAAPPRGVAAGLLSAFGRTVAELWTGAADAGRGSAASVPDRRALRAYRAVTAASRPRGLAASRPRGLAASRPRGLAASRPRGLAARVGCGRPWVGGGWRGVVAGAGGGRGTGSGPAADRTARARQPFAATTPDANDVSQTGRA